MDYPKSPELVALDDQGRPTATQPPRNLDASPFRAQLGLQGLITQRLSLELKAGFLHTFNVDLDSFVGPVGELKLEYVLEPTLSLAGGYRLDVGHRGFANFHEFHAPFVKVELFLLSRITVTGRVEYQLIDFTASNAPFGEKRDDDVIRGEAGVGVAIIDWLFASVKLTLERSGSEYVSPSGKKTDYSQQVVAFQLIAEY